jgi:malate/lactate dehydrogenase
LVVSDRMKLGIVGAGAVGAAAAIAACMRGVARELVLIDKDAARAKGVATDLRYGVPLGRSSTYGPAITTISPAPGWS